MDDSKCDGGNHHSFSFTLSLSHHVMRVTGRNSTLDAFDELQPCKDALDIIAPSKFDIVGPFNAL